jgi:hypothetical protein
MRAVQSPKYIAWCAAYSTYIKKLIYILKYYDI